MKQLLFLVLMILLSGEIIAQTQIISAKRVNISEKLHSGQYNLIGVGDSTGQFYYENMQDPINPLSGVNLRTLQRSIDTITVINEADPFYAADSADIKSRLRNLDTIVGDKKVTQGDTLLTLEQYKLLTTAAAKPIYSITLPYSTTVAGRIALAVSGVDYPTGWTLTADGLNLVVTHNLARWVSNVTVFAKTTGTERQQLFNTAAYNGITCLSSNALKVYSLATISKDIVLYINFE